MWRSFITRAFNTFTHAMLVASLIILCLSFVDAEAKPIYASDRDNEVTTTLKLAIENSRNAAALKALYQSSNYQPLWSGSSEADKRRTALINILQDISANGLNVRDYSLPLLTNESQAFDASYDISISKLFLKLVSDLAHGRTSPNELGIEWDISRDDDSVADKAKHIVSAADFAAEFEKLHPRHKHYQLLRAALTHYRTLANRGGWQSLPNNTLLKPGAIDSAVTLLRQRLSAESGDKQLITSAVPELYDEALERAVKSFQRRQGLDQDGVVGRNTVAALNVPVEQRIEQIALNLERWRWLPGQLGKKHVLVNTAEFTLALYEDDRSVLDMRVIVGKTARQTPIVSKKMKYLVLNPTWTVPPKILHDDILPKLKDQPDYLKTKGMRIFDGWSADANQLSEAEVDWSRVSTRHSPYKVQQAPGVANALGQIKFMFPNQHSVYIHDTPSRSLFSERVRAFSSGCVRVEHPMELAKALLSTTGKWSNTDLQQTLDKGKTKNITLPESVPVHLVYLTSWVSESGELHFRKDIYKRDARLQLALLNPSHTKPYKKS